MSDFKINETYVRFARRTDAAAKWIITTGGMLVIVSVIGILVLIMNVALPLLFPASKDLITKFDISKYVYGEKIMGVSSDEYFERSFVLTDKGRYVFFNAHEGKFLDEIRLPAPHENGATIVNARPKNNNFTIIWSDGSTTLDGVKYRLTYDQDHQRDVQYEVSRYQTYDPLISGQVPRFSIVQEGAEGRLTILQVFGKNQLLGRQTVEKENFLGEVEKEESELDLSGEIPDEITTVVLDRQGRYLYVGTQKGRLMRWDLGEIGSPALKFNKIIYPDKRAITEIQLVFGDISLMIGDEKGELASWFPVRKSDEEGFVLTKIRDIDQQKGPISKMVASSRNKGMANLDGNGAVHLTHNTTGSHLLKLEADNPIVHYFEGQRGNALMALDKSNNITVWELKNPHPEVSLSVLFGKVWYESYEEPDYVWQSSSASDDAEPKFSLIPLIFGSLKGTFYALIFAVPIAIMGAIYTSQFAKDHHRKMIKPSIEIMAAMPSVIIGFLAAIWLAPIVESWTISFFLFLIILPATTCLTIAFWPLIRNHPMAKRIERGYEFMLMIPILAFGIFLSFYFQPIVEDAFFGGDFKRWLYEVLNTRYDQRNSIIISFGLGFMVIPIIFTISDDALSNVPRGLKAASLALGASRWQTVWRVVLPSASPGIFAAVIIGFGRAVGETMVVLMATGNTPILDMSIFNGMRTLSANIAVEIPEAPVDGTLYRILFLSAVILFVMTFVLNTFADIVRMYLRKKYEY